MKDDLELLSAACSRDPEMTKQVSRMLTEKHIGEPEARKMLALVRDGHLRSEYAFCTQRHYPAAPIWINPLPQPRPCYPGLSPWTVWAGSGNSLTAAASNLLAEVATAL